MNLQVVFFSLVIGCFLIVCDATIKAVGTSGCRDMNAYCNHGACLTDKFEPTTPFVGMVISRRRRQIATPYCLCGSKLGDQEYDGGIGCVSCTHGQQCHLADTTCENGECLCTGGKIGSLDMGSSDNSQLKCAAPASDGSDCAFSNAASGGGSEADNFVTVGGECSCKDAAKTPKYSNSAEGLAEGRYKCEDSGAAGCNSGMSCWMVLAILTLVFV